MAEGGNTSGGGNVFAKNFKKQLTRANEKILQKVGKAEKTTDEHFLRSVENFNKQERSAEKVQKHLKHYANCVKALGDASKALHESVRDAYEIDWPEREHVLADSQSLDLLWDDYAEKLSGQVVNSLSYYTHQFVDYRNRIAKRGRKLTDYDSARHAVAALKSSAKKADEGKLQKAEETLRSAEKMYSDINSELLDQLPALYDGRITFFVNSFQTLFNVEADFHSDATKLNSRLCKQLDTLGNNLGDLRVSRPSSLNASHNTSIGNAGSSPTSPLRPPPLTSAIVAEHQSVHQHHDGEEITGEPENGKAESPMPQRSLYPALHKAGGDLEEREPAAQTNGGKSNPFDEEEEEESSKIDSVSTEKTIEEVIPKAAERKSVVGHSKSEATVTDKNVLFKVRATHRYTAEDEDELSFEAGEVIDVVPYDDPDEQDEGWHMGIKQSDGAKGVFPANFTKEV